MDTFLLLSQRQLQTRNHLKPKRDLFLLPRSIKSERINFYLICTMRAYFETTSCVHLHSFRRFSSDASGWTMAERLNLRHRKKGDPFISTLNWLEMTSQYLKNNLQMRRVFALLFLTAPFAERRLQRGTGSWSDLHSPMQQQNKKKSQTCKCSI